MKWACVVKGSCLCREGRGVKGASVVILIGAVKSGI